jgi:hypothetical protein
MSSETKGVLHPVSKFWYKSSEGNSMVLRPHHQDEITEVIRAGFSARKHVERGRSSSYSSNNKGHLLPYRQQGGQERCDEKSRSKCGKEKDTYIYEKVNELNSHLHVGFSAAFRIQGKKERQ